MAKQKQGNSWLRKAAIGAVGLAAALSPNMTARAEDPSSSKNWLDSINPISAKNDIRFSTSYEGNGENYKQTTSIGVAPEGSYSGRLGPSCGQYSETFRSYNVSDSANGEETNYTLAGVKIPKFKLGSLENSGVLFGAFGDVQGNALEWTSKLEKLTGSMALESFKDARGRESTRVGGGIDYQLTPSLLVGAGYDVVKTPEGDTKQVFAKSLLDITQHDFIGAAIYNKDNPDGSSDQGVGVAYVYHGKDVPVGVRAHTRVDWNRKHKFKSIAGHVLVAQNPVIGKGAGSWMVKRGVAEDGMYNLSVVPSSVTRTENDPKTAFRTSSGLAGRFNYSLAELEGVKSGSVSGEVGYNFPGKIGDGYLGIQGGIGHSWNNQGFGETSITAGAAYHLSDEFTFESGVVVPISSTNRDAGPRAMFQLRWVPGGSKSGSKK